MSIWEKIKCLFGVHSYTPVKYPRVPVNGIYGSSGYLIIEECTKCTKRKAFIQYSVSRGKASLGWAYQVIRSYRNDH